MSNLQLGLAMLGGVILAAVVAYNAWVTRKSAPRKADAGSAPVGQADDERLEPAFDATDPLQPLGEESLPSARVAERKPGLDALIDVVVPLALEAEVSGDAILAAMPGTRRVGSKPFAIEARLPGTEDWESPRPGQRYNAVQAGVQLANRHGPLNDIEFSEFVMKTQALADALGATPDFPEMRDEVLRGRELDQFASTHDAQLGFTLRALQAAWSPGYVQQHAARLGFVAGALPGRMVLPGAQGGQVPVLGLMFDTQAALADDPEQTALREVSLLLDVAHVPQAERPYQRMREVASALALAMDGAITDDQGQPLPDATLDQIGSDLDSLYQALGERDLHAGSALARRLFS
ncbi:MAG: cell division protein FtsZ [Polaromonas sp.]|nr:cell division protein FtsZ [Polaromonas sp.]